MSLVSAANAEVYSKTLVQKSCTQISEWNYEHNNFMFTKPTVDLKVAKSCWGFLIKDLSVEELADMEKAKETLEEYDKLYSLIEYCSKLNETITLL